MSEVAIASKKEKKITKNQALQTKDAKRGSDSKKEREESVPIEQTASVLFARPPKAPPQENGEIEACDRPSLGTRGDPWNYWGPGRARALEPVRFGACRGLLALSWRRSAKLVSGRSEPIAAPFRGGCCMS